MSSSTTNVRRRAPSSSSAATSMGSLSVAAASQAAGSSSAGFDVIAPHPKAPSSLLESLQVRDQGVQVAGRNDAAPVRHARDRRLADDAAGADHGDDLGVGVELLAEVLARERRDRLVRRLRVANTAESVRAVTVDTAVADIERRP